MTKFSPRTSFSIVFYIMFYVMKERKIITRALCFVKTGRTGIQNKSLKHVIFNENTQHCMISCFNAVCLSLDRMFHSAREKKGEMFRHENQFCY
jgi:hypothetical protein